MGNVVLSVMAHPDDAEFLCAGSLTRLTHELGWSAHIASVTAGDCGSVALPPDEISQIRQSEGRQAASIIGATYHCLNMLDLLISYNQESLEKVTRLLRQIRPSIVLTHCPSDYLVDHEMTSLVVRAATFAAPVPNFFRDRGHGPALEHVPHLYYCDPIEGKDSLGRPAHAGFAIDISTVIDTKAAMLAAHASQRAWLLRHHGMDQYVESMRDWCGRRGQMIGVGFAEGYQQHLGHGYPQDNLLGALLKRASEPA
jgi:LmbE family N-acetylglucosaminyl deacetylase